MKNYPFGPQERIILSETGERLARACTSKKSDFKYLAVELCATRRPVPKGQELPQVRNSDSVKEIVGKLLPHLTDAIQESFGVICLDARNNVVGFAVPFTGGVASAPVELATMLKVPLLVATCTSIIVCHNHPSGEPTPSADDLEITKRIADACRLVGLRLIDHVILASKGTYSFADNGLIPRFG